MVNSEALSLEMERALCSRLLADCYYVPEPGLIRNVENLEDAMQNVCREAASCVVKMKEGLAEIDDLDELKRDYARLFVGPYQLFAPPYGSIYLEGSRQVMGLSTVDLMERYRRNGVTLAEDFREVADHIAAELEFLYYLGFRAAQALTEDDCQRAAEARMEMESFLRDHLGAWITDFACHVEEHARTGFYRNLARCSRIFVESRLNGEGSPSREKMHG
jgi:TorA maturation chaperone TorD